MDDIDRIIREIIDKFFSDGHDKISLRKVAREARISYISASRHITGHELNLSWERRSRGIIILKNEPNHKL